MTLLAILALFLSAGRLIRRWFHLRLDEAVLYGCLLAFFEVVVIIQVLGLASSLKPAPAWIATIACVGINFLIGFCRRPFPPSRRLWPIPLSVLVGLLAASLIAGARLLLAWVVPPDGWDSLGYHLPIVLQWVRQGNFDLAGVMGAQRYFAWNGELASTWLALLSGNLVYAKIVQVLSLPLLAAAGSVLGRRLAGLRWAWPCAVALPALPIVLIQSGMAYVDALYAAFWLAAAAAALGLARSGRSIHLWAFALAFGLALGTKSTIYFLAPLLLPLAAALIKAPRRPKRILAQTAGCLLLVALAGAGAYIRNAILTGNPIFPYSLTVAGVPVFKGIMSSTDMPAYIEHWFVSSRWGWIVYPFWEHIRGVIGYTHVNGFGPLFAIGWLLLPVAFARAFKRRDAQALAFLSLFPLVVLLFFTLQPVQLPRYIIFLAPLPIVGLAYSLSRAGRILRRAALGIWTIGIVLGCAGVVAYLYRAPGMRYAWHCILSGRSPDPWDYYSRQYHSAGKAWAALNLRLRPGDSVVVSSNELILPWSGIPPRAKVQVVIFGDCVFPQVPRGRTEEEWILEVESLGPRFVVIWSPAWNPGGEERLVRALASRGEPYMRIGRWDSRAYGWVEIYQLKD